MNLGIGGNLGLAFELVALEFLKEVFALTIGGFATYGVAKRVLFFLYCSSAPTPDRW